MVCAISDFIQINKAHAYKGNVLPMVWLLVIAGIPGLWATPPQCVGRCADPSHCTVTPLGPSGLLQVSRCFMFIWIWLCVRYMKPFTLL